MSVKALTLAAIMLGVAPVTLLSGVARADEMQPGASTILRGTVTIKGGVDLPAGVQLAVMLDDVSLADAPSVTLSKTVFAPVGTQSFGYALAYDQASLKPGHRYALRAEIRTGDRLLYISKDAIMALGAVPEQSAIVVEPVAVPLPSALVGSWKIEKIGEKATAPEAPAFMVFRGDGFLSGTGGCNRMMGHVTASGQSLSFGPTVGTRMACPGVRMTQEDAVFSAIREVAAWQIDHGKLLLNDTQGSPVLTLSPNKTADHTPKIQSKHSKIRKSQ